jgi:polyisoprenoid-binding protein YceI
LAGPVAYRLDPTASTVTFSTAYGPDEITGNLTIRGVTQEVTLKAQIFRPKGSASEDLDHLTVKLTGRVNRSDFGATGWSDMVGDEVRILITARIDAQG